MISRLPVRQLVNELLNHSKGNAQEQISELQQDLQEELAAIDRDTNHQGWVAVNNDLAFVEGYAATPAALLADHNYSQAKASRMSHRKARKQAPDGQPWQDLPNLDD